MSDKPINSLLGTLSTKELPSSGRLRNANNSINENHDRDSFHSRLMNSMKDTERSARQDSKDIAEESNPMKQTQKPDEQTATDIPTESNSMNQAQKFDEQTTTDIPTESTNAKDTDDSNHMIKLLSLELKTNPVANVNGNQSQLNPAVNKDINEDGFTNAIINKISNQKTSTTQKVISTLPGNPLLNNHELKSPDGATSNIAQKQAVDVIHETTASLSGKLSTTQVTTNTAQQVTGDIEQEQLQPTPSDKLNTAQTNTKMGERILDILNNPGLSEAATESGEEDSTLQQSKLSDRQATAPSENNLNKNQNKANIKEIQNPVLAIEKAGLNPISDAQKVSNISTHSDEIDNNKIIEMLKEQRQNKVSASNVDKQQSLTQTQIEGEEAPKIFEASANTAESKAAKLFDNTTLTNSSNINPVESAMQSNTSSDNSASNNQGANTDFDFISNTVNNSQKTRSETSFNNTLSQINNSAKPLGTLGNDVADNIIQNAKLYTQGGKSEVKVQLSPPELGTIKLEFKVEDDVLETKITVERSSIKDVIEKDIPRLKELLANADIDVGKLDVSLQDKENSKMDFMNKDFHSNSKSNNTQNSSLQESEFHEDNLEEEAISNNTESTQINYLV